MRGLSLWLGVSLVSASYLVKDVEKSIDFCKRSRKKRDGRAYVHAGEGRRLQPFLVLSRQHSGSTWLNLVMDSQPCVVCGNEKFHETRKAHFFNSSTRRNAMLLAFEVLGMRRRGRESEGRRISRRAITASRWWIR